MDLQHPSITHIRATGGHNVIDDEIYDYDALGNPIYLYDDVIAMHDGIYRVASLTDDDLMDKLENGGIYQQAK